VLVLINQGFSAACLELKDAQPGLDLQLGSRIAWAERSWWPIEG
jgi:hypothetical protein